MAWPCRTSRIGTDIQNEGLATSEPYPHVSVCAMYSACINPTMLRGIRVAGRRVCVRLIVWTFSTVLIQSAAFHNPLWAQRSMTATARPVCTSCEIRVDSVAVLGRIGDAETLTGSSRVVRAASGRFYAGPTYSPGKVAVYDAGGAFVQAIGHEGAGPGEVTSVEYLAVGPGDTLAVFGSDNMVLFAPDFRVIRDTRFNAAPRAGVVLPGGNAIIHAYYFDRESFGNPFHTFDASGARRRSFGEESGVVRGADLATQTRWLAPAAAGVWTARPNRYEIELRDTTGTVQLRVSRQPDWFEPWEAYPTGAPHQVKPPSQIVAVSEDGPQQLWILSYVAAASWRPSSQTGRELRVTPGTQDRLFDSVIDVIDIQNGNVLASRILPVAAAGFAASNILYVHDETTDGLTVVRVYRATLTTNRRLP